MKSIKRVLTGALVASIAGGGLLIGADAASAAVTPPWEPDPNALGSLSFYDATGNQITSGTSLSHLFDYAVASTTAARTTTTKATVFFGFPDHTKADPSLWFSSQATAASTFPNTTAPAPVNGFGRQPVAAAGPTEANLSAVLGGVTLDTTPGYANVVQIRVKDSGSGLGNGFQSTYWETDISYDTTTGAWTQLFPAPPAQVATTVAAITATPASPAPSGTTSVTLASSVSAADSTHPAGSVELFNGSTDLGPVAGFNAATGAISSTASVADGNSYNFKYVFTPTSSGYAASSSPVLAYSVNAAAATTSTVLSGPTSTTFGTSVTIHADVKTPNASGTAVPSGAGSVQFAINGTAAGSPVPVTATGADFVYNPAAPGSQTITASFVPAAGQNFTGSSDTTGVTVVTSAATYAPDPQTVVVTVPSGTLVISTPYTPTRPFNLGNMTLTADGTGLSASAPFGDPAAPAAGDPGTAGSTTNGVTITDTRPGSTGWTASAQTTDFTGPAGTVTPIDGNNLSFTGVTPKYITGNALQLGSVNTHSITAFKTAKKSFADTTHGPGTVNITGVLSLTAPTSTQPGLYTATVTFTIV